MKTFFILFSCLLLTNVLFGQAIKERTIVSIGVTFNQVLRLTIINSDVNFEYDNFSVSLGINGSSPSFNGNNHKTSITIQSSTRWTLIYGAEYPMLVGINNPINTLSLNNVGFEIINNGLHEFGNSEPLISNPTNNATAISPLQIYPVVLIEDNHITGNANAGDDKDNSFTIDWRCGTAELGMNPVKLLDMAPASDKYYVNVIFELKGDFY